MRLWSLDEPDDDHADLAALTLGHGPGPKLELLNRLVGVRPLTDGRLVVCDDDIEFAHGGVDDLLDLVDRAEFDIAMPAHGRGSNSSYWFTGRARLSRARLTTFVEGGPLVVMSARATEHLLPFREDLGMGWGVELVWQEAARHHGLQMGIVDAAPIAHKGAVAAEYDRDAAQCSLDESLRRHGVDSLPSTMRTFSTWRPWQRRPPWLR